MTEPEVQPPPSELRGWIEGARQGEPAAAEALVEWLYPAVIAVVRRRLPARMEAEDAAQEVFLRLFRKLHQFRGEPESLVRWVRRLAFTTCLNLLRHERRRPELRWSDLDESEARTLEAAASAEPDAATLADRHAARNLLRQVLDTLPAADRWLIEWLELEERSVAEVIRETGWSAVRVRVRAHRARRRLERALKQVLMERDETY